MKCRLMSVWPGGSGPGIWFLAGSLMPEQTWSCLPYPRTLSLPAPWSFQPSMMGIAGAGQWGGEVPSGGSPAWGKGMHKGKLCFPVYLHICVSFWDAA